MSISDLTSTPTSTPFLQGRGPRWSYARVARLAFLVGQGWDARRIAEDPAVASTPVAVHRQIGRFGLAIREAGGLRLPPSATACLDAAAGKRGLHRDGLTRQLLIAAASSEALIDNILDDGE